MRAFAAYQNYADGRFAIGIQIDGVTVVSTTVHYNWNTASTQYSSDVQLDIVDE